MSRGLNLQLYNKLFWLSSGIFLLLYHAILLAMNLQEEDFIQKTITGSLCSNPSKPVVCLSKYFTENSKNIVLRVSFVGFNMGYSLILYFLVTTSRNILRNNSNRVKAQIGIFRRNIWTLKETIVQMIVVSLMELTRIELIYYALKTRRREQILERQSTSSTWSSTFSSMISSSVLSFPARLSTICSRKCQCRKVQLIPFMRDQEHQFQDEMLRLRWPDLVRRLRGKQTIFHIFLKLISKEGRYDYLNIENTCRYILLYMYMFSVFLDIIC